MNLAFLNIGTQEMMLIIIVALLLFGGKKLPELARGLGKGIREFKDASEGIKREITEQINNFEKEVDVVKDDLKVDTEYHAPELASKDESSETDQEEDNTVAKTEKKVPQFTAPEGTYEHQAYRTPTADDYYSYGYKDHFASNETNEASEEAKDASEETNTSHGSSATPNEDESAKNA